MGIRVARVYDSGTAICTNTLITYIRVNVPGPNVLGANVFGTGIFHGQNDPRTDEGQGGSRCVTLLFF